ncbi:UDP-2,3-diacylglucosamine diphosphatase [Hafnia psychrotolerans]|uniref:UDP-2,3-diacylglucosamine hydrolase n=1 Tax=Hafnia psychrotolerans TaxID=1477018 RepID=A0ABQ1GWK6_9GAMM|nr:UDP-2,3-diacylglucosamine diphosphatase [Hafnia psychrotolerans]GGA51787.1 UDP-2,3-diacylglucosamine hydrolase [Hafnia psychrotolerans]
MATFFIADIHLCAQEPAITAGFLRFLREDAPQADALYILGDLFEAWIGDDDPQPLHGDIAAALNTLHQQGVPCFFIHGNRDFLVGRRFARDSSMQILPETKLLQLYGRRLLILHGDTLCTDDIGYQKFRKKVRNPLIQKIFLALPLKWRLSIAARMRADSKASNRGKSLDVMDVNPQAVINAMQENRAEWMIHGHTHRPAIHDVPLNGKTGHRAVLGAWHEEGSMITVSADGIELVTFPF